MASKTTLTAKNLEALGAERLAELLIEISGGDAVIKRRLRLELAGAASPAEAAREIRKRLATIARARSYIEWPGIKPLVEDLSTQRRAIVEKLAPADPAEALDLMWRFLALGESVLARCDDSNGTVGGVFNAAIAELAAIAEAARPDPITLADQVFAAIQANDYGQNDGLIGRLAPALGPAGVAHLKARVLDFSRTPVKVPPAAERKVIGWAPSGKIYADQLARSRQESIVRMALETIADLQGDVDGFIAQQSDRAKTVPSVAAEIARRLLAAGRAEAALAALETVPQDRARLHLEWQKARLAAIEALGRTEEAQAFRWTCFEQSLSASHLRDYLKRLADFDDLEAEQRALDFVQASASLHEALHFLVRWPALDRAADLVLARADALDGDLYHLLAPAAEALQPRHPLAATLVLRAMINFALDAARTSRYGHAARHLLECRGLASRIEDFGAFETHEAYLARLRTEHARKSSFWSLVD